MLHPRHSQCLRPAAPRPVVLCTARRTPPVYQHRYRTAHVQAQYRHRHHPRIYIQLPCPASRTLTVPSKDSSLLAPATPHTTPIAAMPPPQLSALPASSSSSSCNSLRPHTQQRSHQHLRLSTDLQDLPNRSVNLVHLRRPHAALLGQQPARLLTKPSLQAVLDVVQPQPGIRQLLSGVRCPFLQQQLQQDLHLAVQLFSTTLQQQQQQPHQQPLLPPVQHLAAKLEVVTRQSCPKWHADYVRLRMLCTYAGPGTWFVEDRHVVREVAASGLLLVASVDEGQACQAGPGDLLLMKGHAFLGLTAGGGAVHKSPELKWGETRLLLTVDDAACC